MVFHVPLSRGVNLDWIFSNRFALAVTQKNQSPLKRCEEREETGFFSACCLQLLAECSLASRTWHCLCVLERETPHTTAESMEQQGGDWGAVGWHQNLKCVGLRGTPGCHFSLSQCAEAKKALSQGSLILSVSETRQMNPLSRREHVGPCWSLCPKPSLQMFLESSAQLWWGGVEKTLTHLFDVVSKCCQNFGDSAVRTNADRPDWRLVVVEDLFLL